MKIMEDSDIEKFCSILNKYLKKQFNYKSDPAYALFSNISVNRKKIDLYLRYLTNYPDEPDLWNRNTLVIAKISFYKQRKGNGASLLNFLVDVSEAFGIHHIGIESAYTESIESFARKYKFKKIKNTRQWSVPIKKLRKVLQEQR